MKRIIVKEVRTKNGTTAYYFGDETFETRPEAIQKAKEQVASEGGGVVDFAEIVDTDKMETRDYKDKLAKTAKRKGVAVNPNRKVRGVIPKNIAELRIVASYNVKGNYVPDMKVFN